MMMRAIHLQNHPQWLVSKNVKGATQFVPSNKHTLALPYLSPSLRSSLVANPLSHIQASAPAAMANCRSCNCNSASRIAMLSRNSLILLRLANIAAISSWGLLKEQVMVIAPVTGERRRAMDAKHCLNTATTTGTVKLFPVARSKVRLDMNFASSGENPCKDNLSTG